MHVMHEWMQPKMNQHSKGVVGRIVDSKA